jgi:hypothetical protein
MVEHVAAVGATDAIVQRLSVRQQTLLCSVYRPPHFCCVEKLTASFEDGGYKYLLASPWEGLLTFLTLLCIL